MDARELPEDGIISTLGSESGRISRQRGIRACVYIDYDSMDDYVNATGYQVAVFANEGTHGGLSVNHKPHVWDDTMDETVNNGSLLQLAVKYLRSQGILVKA